jgi:uncharacterized protein with beta-barrel porin domain
MNLLSKIALLFGRRKFEEFAQANPALPDDALAVANTLDTYASFGNWTNSGGSATMNGGALICIGSNEYWLVAAGRALGSVTGTEAKEYPTNAVSGFIAQPLNNMRSNLTSVAVRDETNALWLLSVSTNSSPPAVYLGTTNNPTATLLAPSMGVTFQDTNIVATSGGGGLITFYSSLIPTIAGATCAPSIRMDGSSSHNIMYFWSAISNAATFEVQDIEGSLGNGDVETCPTCTSTNQVLFFR